MIENQTLLALNIATLVVILFSAHLLVLRAFTRQVYLPLAICLVAIGVIICQPALVAFAPNVQLVFLILSLPAMLLIAPCFWFYVQGLTWKTPWRFSRQAIIHFVPFLLGMLIATSSLMLPQEIKQALLVEGNEEVLSDTHVVLRYFIYGLLISTFVLVLSWVVQSGFYFYKIVQRLSQYRQHLKDLFASTETKEIKWLTWLLMAIGSVWLVAAVNIVLDNLFFSTEFQGELTSMVMLMMIWSVSVWGLRQKPGFEELYHGDSELEQATVQVELSQSKYQRSALDEQLSAQIASKIEHAMQQEQLFLNSALSLQKLAKHIHTSPNYISQTLNESLGMNFFDYVNKYRIEEAKQRLERTNDTVLDIAMAVGFNAKSSFYTAFKKEVQQTPSQYRKQLA